MNRREFIAGATVAIGGLGQQNLLAAPAKPRQPNLVYVFADQLRTQSCGYAGDEYARTPNMDRLAAEGCNFHQAISSTPVCAPYRASLMTGKYQSSTGMVINELRLSPEHECLGHVLQNAGYETAYLGKWHLWANQLGHHNLIKNGFVPPGKYRLGFDQVWAAYNFNHYYYHSPYFLNDASSHIRSQYEPDAQTDAAISYVSDRGRDNKSFALFLSWGPPHYPWGWDNVPPGAKEAFSDVKIPRAPSYSNVSDPYADKWAQIPENYDSVVDDWQRAYYAQTANLDWNLGRLMKALDDTGLRENTILVFTSDHGEMFGAHGRQSKYIFYEEAARVPMLIRWPGKIPAKHVSDALLGTPDIMPTLLSMMQLPVPKTVEGLDLSAYALGTGSGGPVAAHLQGMGATAAWTDGTEWRAVRDQEYTYGIYRRDGKELLFNHRTDPFQMTDLAADQGHAATLGHYRAISQAWRKQQNDTFESCSYYERWTKDRNIVNTARGVGQDLDALNKITDKWFAGGVGDRKVDDFPVGVP